MIFFFRLQSLLISLNSLNSFNFIKLNLMKSRKNVEVRQFKFCPFPYCNILLKNCLAEWKAVKVLFHSHAIFYFTCMKKLINMSEIIIFNEELPILFFHRELWNRSIQLRDDSSVIQNIFISQGAMDQSKFLLLSIDTLIGFPFLESIFEQLIPLWRNKKLSRWHFTFI